MHNYSYKFYNVLATFPIISVGKKIFLGYSKPLSIVGALRWGGSMSNLDQRENEANAMRLLISACQQDGTSRRDYTQ